MFLTRANFNYFTFKKYCNFKIIYNGKTKRNEHKIICTREIIVYRTVKHTFYFDRDELKFVYLGTKSVSILHLKEIDIFTQFQNDFKMKTLYNFTLSVQVMRTNWRSWHSLCRQSRHSFKICIGDGLSQYPLWRWCLFCLFLFWWFFACCCTTAR